jgi:hypothetical protein
MEMVVDGSILTLVTTAKDSEERGSAKERAKGRSNQTMHLRRHLGSDSKQPDLFESGRPLSIAPPYERKTVPVQ